MDRWEIWWVCKNSTVGSLICCRWWWSRTPDLLSRLRHLLRKTNCFLLENCSLPQSVISKTNNTPDQQKSEFQFTSQNQVHVLHYCIGSDTIRESIINCRSMISQYITFVMIQYTTATYTIGVWYHIHVFHHHIRGDTICESNINYGNTISSDFMLLCHSVNCNIITMFHQELKQPFHTSDPIPSNTRWSKHAMLACSTLRPLDSSSFMMFTRRPGRFSHSMWISNPSSVHATSIYSHRHQIFPSQYKDQQQRMNTGVIITVITPRKSLLHNCTTSQHQRAVTKKRLRNPTVGWEWSHWLSRLACEEEVKSESLSDEDSSLTSVQESVSSS